MAALRNWKYLPEMTGGPLLELACRATSAEPAATPFK